MTDRRFEYDERLLEQCARSSSLSPSAETAATEAASDAPCLELFEQHQLHYGRSRNSNSNDPQELEHKHEQDSSQQSQHGNTNKLEDPVYERHDDGSDVGRRFQAFVQNVRFVYRHNRDLDLDSYSSSSSGGSSSYRRHHQVALNRFSDMFLNEIFVGSEEEDWSQLWAKSLTDRDVPVTHLNDIDSILSAAASFTSSSFHPLLGIGKGSMNRLNPKREFKTTYRDSRILTLPPDDLAPEKFATPDADHDVNGAILSVKPVRKKAVNSYITDTKTDPKTTTKPDSIDIPPGVGGGGVGIRVDEANTTTPEENEGGETDFYTRHLNWATKENPDGVAIVNEAFDQGTCGACWAFATTGSLEASASRRSAYNAFKTFARLHQDNVASVDPAILHAKQVEKDSFSRLNLSIQELVDCDNSGNQGCTGGNPVLSFYFIHRYGLTSWSNYPYAGRQEHCHLSLARQPVATVKSWGVISPNHEKHMELVVRYIGPIAVGVNGASSSFLSYSGGIYDNPYCKQGANHALLITGYGEELKDDGSVVRFWYARNSWGTGWGENGYVRIKRGVGRKGSWSVCGIARSASVALGGVLLPASRMGGSLDDDETTLGSFAAHNPLERLCYKAGLQTNPICMNSKAWSLGVIGILLGAIAAFVLTRDSRLRRRRRARQISRRREEQERLSRLVAASDHEDLEGSPLLLGSEAPGPAGYGSGEAESGAPPPFERNVGRAH